MELDIPKQKPMELEKLFFSYNKEWEKLHSYFFLK